MLVIAQKDHTIINLFFKLRSAWDTDLAQSAISEKHKTYGCYGEKNKREN